MSSYLPLLLSVLLVISSWAMFVPQAVRVRRVGTAGVSLRSWSAMLVSRVVMIVYGVLVADATQFWAAAVPFVCSVLIVVACAHRAPAAERRQAWMLMGVVLVSAVGTLLADAVLVVGVALVTVAAVSAVPQALQVRRAADVGGVSVVTWVASACSSALWVVHGIRLGDVPVIACNSVWLVASAAIVVTVRQRRAPANAVAAAAAAAAP